MIKTLESTKWSEGSLRIRTLIIIFSLASTWTTICLMLLVCKATAYWPPDAPASEVQLGQFGWINLQRVSPNQPVFDLDNEGTRRSIVDSLMLDINVNGLCFTIVIGVVVTVVLWRISIWCISQLKQVGTCLQCGYRLQGLTTARCPECGTISSNTRARECTWIPQIGLAMVVAIGLACFLAACKMVPHSLGILSLFSLDRWISMSVWGVVLVTFCLVLIVTFSCYLTHLLFIRGRS